MLGFMQSTVKLFAAILVVVGGTLLFLFAKGDRDSRGSSGPEREVLETEQPVAADLDAAVVHDREAAERGERRTIKPERSAAKPKEQTPATPAPVEMLSFRAIDVTGTPLARRTFVRSTEGRGSIVLRIGEEVVTTDAEGFFELPRLAETSRVAITVLAEVDDHEDTVLCEGHVPREQQLAAGATPHEVVFYFPRVLAQGQVFNEKGEGVDGIFVQLGPHAVFQEWTAYQVDGSARTEGGGFFTIYGPPTRASYEIFAKKWGKRAGPLTIEPETTGLLLELYTPQVMRVRFEFGDTGHDLAHAKVELFRDGELASEPSYVDPSGFVKAVIQKAEMHTVVSYYAGREVGRTENVLVASTTPPLVVDLSERLIDHRLQLDHADADDLVCAVQWRAAGSEDEWVGASFRGKEIRLPSTESAVDFKLQVKGGAYHEIFGWSGNGTFRP